MLEPSYALCGRKPKTSLFIEKKHGESIITAYEGL
jgi:hypothetical protein